MVQYDGNGTPKKAPLSLQIDLARFEPATEEEKRQQDVMSKSTSFLRDGLRRLFKNPLAVGSLIMLFLIVAVILIAPLVVPYGYSEILSVNGKRDKGAKNMAPFTYSEMEQEYIANGGERSPISSAPTTNAGIISSAWSTAPGYPWRWAFSPASSS